MFDEEAAADLSRRSSSQYQAGLCPVSRVDLSCGKRHPYVTLDDCVIPQTCKSSFENVHPQPNMGDINQEVRDGSQKESVGHKHDFIDAAEK